MSSKIITQLGLALMLASLTACIGTDITPPYPGDNGEPGGDCTTICFEQPLLSLKFERDSREQEHSIEVTHGPGNIEIITSLPINVDIEKINELQSKITFLFQGYPFSFYSNGLVFNSKEMLPENGIYSDAILFKLHGDERENLLSSEILPIKYEVYDSFDITNSKGERKEPAFSFILPSGIATREVLEAGLPITREGAPQEFNVLGAYAEWEIIDLPPSLSVSQASGVGPATIYVTPSDYYKEEITARGFSFEIKDSLSGRTKRVSVLISVSQRPILANPQTFDREITTSTTLEELVWEASINDPFLGQRPEKQVNWAFANIPEGYNITPISGNTAQRSTIKIQRVQPFAAGEIRTLNIPIEWQGIDDPEYAGESYITLDLSTEVSLISKLNPSVIPSDFSGNILMDFDRRHIFETVFFNEKSYTKSYFKGNNAVYLDSPPLGENTFYSYEEDIFQKNMILTVVPATTYEKALSTLDFTIKKSRYQTSTQSLLVLSDTHELHQLKWADGLWNISQCLANDAIIDFERAYDDIIAISETSPFTLHENQNGCFLEEIKDDKIQAVLGEDDPSVLSNITIDRYGHLIIHNNYEEPKVQQLYWPWGLGTEVNIDSFYGDENNTTQPTQATFIRDYAVILGKSINAISGTLSQDGKLFLSDDGRILAPGYDELNDSPLARIAQSEDDKGLKNFIGLEGRQAWRLHISDDRIWLNEYQLPPMMNNTSIAHSRTLELDFPDGLTVDENSFVEILTAHNGKTLFIFVDDNIWTVPLR